MTNESEARSVNTQDSGNPTEAGASPENGGERRERRSRDRYGRDRRERNPESRQDKPGEEAVNHGADPTSDAALPTPAQERPAARSYFERAQASAAAAETEAAPKPAPAPAAMAASETPPAVQAAETDLSAPVQVPEKALPVAAPAPSDLAPEPTPAPKAMPIADSFTLPIDHLQQLAQSSGLVWVNSDSAKVAAVQAAIAAEPPAVHVPRERPPAVVLNEGPLVLVETRKDLQTLKVPF